MYSDTAYTPFGEPYATAGTADLNFTGMNSDTSGSSYDFRYRQYGTQGRWPTPDPAGLAAVDFSDPQSWNRYAYVKNSPTNLVDPSGLDSIDPFKKVPPGPYRRGHRPSQTSRHGSCWAAGGGVCGSSWDDPFWLLNMMMPDWFYIPEYAPQLGVLYSGPIYLFAFPGPGINGGGKGNLGKESSQLKTTITCEQATNTADEAYKQASGAGLATAKQGVPSLDWAAYSSSGQLMRQALQGTPFSGYGLLGSAAMEPLRRVRIILRKASACKRSQTSIPSSPTSTPEWLVGNQ